MVLSLAAGPSPPTNTPRVGDAKPLNPKLATLKSPKSIALPSY